MPHRKLNVSPLGMIERYQRLLTESGYVADAAQMAAATRLQALYTELLHFKVQRNNPLTRILTSPKVPRGVYIWGGVGRGKSFLMDCFFDSVPYRRKKRLHFHAFMQRIDRELAALRGQRDPLMKVARKIADETRLLCFDEFHVTDIVEAMILGRLLEGLFAHGVILVVTSNQPPDGLYPNGLQRANFLPTIELLKRQLDVIEVEGGTDYRLRTLEQGDIYHVPADEAAERRMLDYFRLAAGEEGEIDGRIEVYGRGIPFIRRAPGVIWFDFAHLCGHPRSRNDYLEIARSYHTLLLSGIPMLSENQTSAAICFGWLVDVLYDHKAKLIATADYPAESIYPEGAYSGEFRRTASRLMEMRSREYLALPKIR